MTETKKEVKSLITLSRALTLQKERSEAQKLEEYQDSLEVEENNSSVAEKKKKPRGGKKKSNAKTGNK